MGTAAVQDSRENHLMPFEKGISQTSLQFKLLKISPVAVRY